MTLDGKPICTWKSQVSNRFDQQLFQAAHPELFENSNSNDITRFQNEVRRKMSTNALKAAATGNQVAQHSDKPTTLAGLLADPKLRLKWL